MNFSLPLSEAVLFQIRRKGNKCVIVSYLISNRSFSTNTQQSLTEEEKNAIVWNECLVVFEQRDYGTLFTSWAKDPCDFSLANKTDFTCFLTSNENLWGHLRGWSIKKKQILWDFCIEMQRMTVRCWCKHWFVKVHMLISYCNP